MIHNNRCFSIIFFFLVGLIASCKTSDTLKYSTVYRGHSIEGMHARAHVLINDAVIVAGPNGKFCGRFFGGDLVEQPALIGAEDIRDLHLFNDGSMVMMNSGDTARIYYISYNGEQKVVFDSSGVFLDGLDFWDDLNGIVYGDPIDGKFFLLRTFDGGKKWFNLSPLNFPGATENESGFAASGTGIQCVGDSTVYFATGMGALARMYCSYDRGMTWEVKSTPIKSGDSFGIYSIYYWSKNEGIIVGGSWKEIDYNKNICYYTADGGATWENRSKGLAGYTSCVQGNDDGTFLAATGDKGTFYSLDKGEHWNRLVERNYYSLSVTKDYVVLIGRDGVLEILKYSF